MEQGIIRFEKVTPGEVTILQDLARLTFYETFAAENTAEDMQKYLEEELSTEKLATEIDDPSFSIFIAKTGGKISGYLTLHLKNDPDTPGKQGLKIERLYILQEFQGLGYGIKLLEYAEDKLRQLQLDYLWLGVWERNYRAIRFYEKNGFVRTGQEVFILGEDVQTDYIMKRYLSRDNEVPNIK